MADGLVVLLTLDAFAVFRCGSEEGDARIDEVVSCWFLVAMCLEHEDGSCFHRIGCVVDTLQEKNATNAHISTTLLECHEPEQICNHQIASRMEDQ